MNTTTKEVLLRTSLQDCREKYDKLSKEYLELTKKHCDQEGRMWSIYDEGYQEGCDKYLLTLNQLRAELAAEREKRAADNAQYSADEIEWNKQLAAAQATIAEMRGKVSQCLDEHYVGRKFSTNSLHDALALPTNQDALHEALARECERLAEVSEDYHMRTWLRKEAAAHRARKEEK